jgi:phosphoglycolate phosphatase
MTFEASDAGHCSVTCRLAIFDLDGTLSDSFPWFLTIINAVADRHGFRRIAPDQVEALRGMGSREIIRYLDVPLWKLPVIARDMRRLKAAHLDDIALFPGVDEMLRALTARGVTLAIVSSDNKKNVRRALGPTNAALIAHYACGASLFGKPAKFRQVIRALGIAAAQTICIGDEVRDAEAARKAGLAFGAVIWGYATEAALRAQAPQMVFATMEDIVAAFG